MILLDVITMTLFGRNKISIVSLLFSTVFSLCMPLMLVEDAVANSIGRAAFLSVIPGASLFYYFWLEARLGRLMKILGLFTILNTYVMNFVLTIQNVNATLLLVYFFCSVAAAILFNVTCIVSVLKLVKENPTYKTNEKQYRVFKISVFAIVYPILLVVGYIVLLYSTNLLSAELLIPYWKLGYACIQFMLQYNKAVPEKQKEVSGLSQLHNN